MVTGFGAVAVLIYYAIANASASTLSPEQRRWPKALTVAGALGGAVLVFTLPAASVVTGFARGAMVGRAQP